MLSIHGTTFVAVKVIRYVTRSSGAGERISPERNALSAVRASKSSP
jgi:hypothetical protein